MFKLQIETTNSAFDAGAGGDPEAEIVRILEDVVAAIRQGAVRGTTFDHNGKHRWLLADEVDGSLIAQGSSRRRLGPCCLSGLRVTRNQYWL